MKKYKWFLWILLAIVVIFFMAIAYFFISNDAPIITGKVMRNIEYKPGLKLDIYEPTTIVYEKTPVVLYIHGGAWIGGLKESLNFNRFNEASNNLRAAGYAIVSINYTLAEANRSPFPACIEDAKDAIKWIDKNSSVYNFDLGNIGLFGESAGAHIAMMVAYDRQTQDTLPVKFNYVIDIYGPNQLEGIYHTAFIDTLYSMRGRLPEKLQSYLDLEKYIFGFDPRQDTIKAMEMMKTYSPYFYLSSSVPPTLLIQGDGDRIVPVLQSTSLKAKLDSLGVENEMHILKGTDHALAKATPEQKEDVQQWIVAFIEKHYSKEHTGLASPH
jgi:acetyl esterase/lipase